MSVDGLLFNAPATRERVASLLSRLCVGAEDRVLDVGCGRGEMLAMLAEATGCDGVGVDPNEKELTVARARSVGRGSVTWCCSKVEDESFQTLFDAAICVGATHAFGSRGEGLPRTLEGLGGLVRTGGRILVGEGFWEQPPNAGYLDATGFEAHDLRSHRENAALGESWQLGLIHAEVSSAEEWVRFETAFLDAALERAASSAGDAEAVANLQHWQAWHDAYQRWGRDTLGFGYYVFEKSG